MTTTTTAAATTTFAHWFRDTWKRPDENETRALLRLSLKSECAPMTIRRAIEGRPVRAATATTLAQLTGWKVEAGVLALGADPSSATKPKRAASNPPRRGSRRGIGRGA